MILKIKLKLLCINKKSISVIRLIGACIQEYYICFISIQNHSGTKRRFMDGLFILYSNAGSFHFKSNLISWFLTDPSIFEMIQMSCFFSCICTETFQFRRDFPDCQTSGIFGSKTALSNGTTKNPIVSSSPFSALTIQFFSLERFIFPITCPILLHSVFQYNRLVPVTFLLLPEYADAPSTFSISLKETLFLHFLDFSL